MNWTSLAFIIAAIILGLNGHVGLAGWRVFGAVISS